MQNTRLQTQRAAPAKPEKVAPVKADLIGVLVLAAGVAAVLGMGALAYFVFSGESEQQNPKIEAEIRPSAQDAAILAGSDAAIPATDQTIQGQWEAPFNGGESAVIEFKNGRFQILFAPVASQPKRLYGIGRYKIEDAQQGIISLEPDPAAKMEPPAGLLYEVLTLRQYKIEVSTTPEAEKIFIKPNVINGMNDQVHPLFFHSDAGDTLTGWTRRGGGQKP